MMNKNNEITKGIDLIYQDRRNFCVAALTGYTATGCSRLANYMADKEFYKADEVRRISNIEFASPKVTNNTDIFFKENNRETNSSISQLIFKQKYTICYNFIEKNYQEFTIIKYSKVLWLITLMKICKELKDENELPQHVKSLLEDKFQPSTVHDSEYRNLRNEQPWKNLDKVLEGIRFKDLYEEIKLIVEVKNNSPAYNKDLAKIFLGKDTTLHFSEFFKNVNERLFQIDYYSACFFYHRLGAQIRKTGEVERKYGEVFKENESFTYVYEVVEVINKIIKGIRYQGTENAYKEVDGNVEKDGLELKFETKGCRVVIDSIRNSLEARYLKERYSAFYLIAVHDEEDSAKQHLEDKLKHVYNLSANELTENRKYILRKEIDAIFNLGKVEQKNEHFEEGKFSAPNIAQCVADAEIHITNANLKDNAMTIFQSMAEQWLKFASLILHPGLITPSSEERCMVVAYTAKFNSGCLSRQVGAVITNKAHSIRSIGWNDVPYGQVPCSLRSLFDYPQLDKQDNPSLIYIYSDFERGKGAYEDGKSFKDRILLKYNNLNNPHHFTGLNGLPFPYCFKALHNEFEDKKNQVHTRSLHAEENAILQIARFGGEGLENGIIYVTASPCELCCKKLYQIGVRKIIYIDEYPGISRQNIISIGFKRPDLKQFQGAYGITYFKLYQPIMPLKEELGLRVKDQMPLEKKSLDTTLRKVLEKNPNLKFSNKNELDEFIKVLTEKYLSKP